MSDEKQAKLRSLLADKGGKIVLGSNLTPAPPKPSRIRPIEEIVPGQVAEIDGRLCYHMHRSLREVWPEASPIIDHYRWAVLGPGQVTDTQPPAQRLAEISQTEPRRVIYLDIETCGFAGNAIFLIGWCHYDPQADDFVLEQVLARDYAEEAGIIAAVNRRFADAAVMATFNGKRFDLPSIHERGLIHRTPIQPPAIHFDLLDHARAQWKKILPNCRLQTLEACLCKRYRTGDIPGDQIPDVYHEFVRTGDARKLAMIVQHNLLDIVTLAELAAHIIAGTALDD